MKQLRWVLAALALAVGLGAGFSLEPRDAHADRLWSERENSTAALTPDDPVARTSFNRLVKDVGPAVVFISVEKRSGLPGGFGRRGHHRDGLGTGFVIHADGWVVTNNHVVDGAESIKVRLADRREFEAKVVGTDPQTDIALVKFEPTGQRLTVAPLGRSDEVEIGDWVIAIGSPFGLAQTVTAGIVSAKGRVGVAPDGKTDLYEDFIQTDASINPGNSGGPLINMRGEVVGVNTAINSAGQGIGFAVPIDMVKTVLPQLKDGGRVKRSMLGLMIQDVDQEIANQLGLSAPSGALVNEVVPGGPAEKAGIRPGDVVLAFDGKRVDSSKSLRWLASNAGAGRAVTVELWRDGKAARLDVTLAALTRGGEAPDVGEAPSDSGPTALGVRVSDVNDELAQRFQLSAKAGVVVTAVEPSSLAAKLQLQPGDVILKVGKAAVRTSEDLAKAVARVSKGQVITLLVRRGDRELFRAGARE